MNKRILATAAAALALLPTASDSALYGPLNQRWVPGTNYQLFGDSIMAIGNFYCVPPTASGSCNGYANGAQTLSFTGYLEAMLGAGLQMNYAAGYGGPNNGLNKVIVLTSGAGCPANGSLVFTSSTPLGNPALAAGNLTVPIGSGGGATVGATLIPASLGAGYISQPTWTIFSGGTCSTYPTYENIIGGSGTLGVYGDTTAGMLARIGDVLAASGVQMIFMDGGTNDITAATNCSTIEATIENNRLQMYQQIIAAGKTIVDFGITPRGWGAPASCTVTQAEQVRLNVNQFVVTQAYYRQFNNLYAQPQIFAAIVDKYWTDSTNTSGGPLAGMTYDTLHEATEGAWYMALAGLRQLKPIVPPIDQDSNNLVDFYLATYNTRGNLLGSVGLTIGSGGTVSVPLSGIAPTGWTCSRVSGTAVLAPTISVPTRSDLPSGTALQMTASSIVGGINEEGHRCVASVNPSATVASGVTVYATADLQIISMGASASGAMTSTVTALGLWLKEAATTVQSSQSMYGTPNNSSYWPSTTWLASMPDATVLPGFGQAGPGSYNLQIRSRPITLQAATSGFTVGIYDNCDSTLTNPCAFSYQLRNVAVRICGNATCTL